MVIEPKQTMTAYRCPHCGAGVKSVVGIFALSADSVKLKCTCGGSEMTITYTGDGKVRLTVPCIVCPTPHIFTVSQNVFFGRELFVLPCPYSDINICIIGEENHVKAELARTELELLDMLEENGVENFEALHKKQKAYLTDPQILDIVKFVISDLDAEGKIFCGCPEGEGEYETDVTDDGVIVKCKNCGRSRFIPTDSMLGAHAFLNCDALYLEESTDDGETEKDK